MAKENNKMEQLEKTIDTLQKEAQEFSSLKEGHKQIIEANKLLAKISRETDNTNQTLQTRLNEYKEQFESINQQIENLRSYNQSFFNEFQQTISNQLNSFYSDIKVIVRDEINNLENNISVKLEKEIDKTKSEIKELLDINQKRIKKKYNVILVFSIVLTLAILFNIFLHIGLINF